VYREEGTIVPVGDPLRSRSRRILVTVAHVLGSRTVVILGLVLAAWTGYSAAKNLWFVFNGRVAKGVVASFVEQLSADWQISPDVPLGLRVQGVGVSTAQQVYRAVVTFSDGGRSFNVLTNARATARAFPVGSKVDVVFPPGRPERARVRPDLPDTWSQAGLLFVATVLGAGSLRLWWRLARRWMIRRSSLDRESIAEPECVAEDERADQRAPTVGSERPTDAEP
jgi:hypothetical protein